MRPEFPLCGEGSWEFLPTAGLCCWCYVASVRGRGSRREKGKRSYVVVRREAKYGETRGKKKKAAEVTLVVMGDQTSPSPYYHHLLPPVT